MARRAMNALQLALGSVGSGIQGYSQARTAREAQELEAARYATEQERIKRAEERQMAQDAARVREEQRTIATTPGFVTADRLASMTMPGATPLQSMQPTMRQKVGDQEYVYAPGVADAEKHRRDVMARSMQRAEKAADLTEKSNRIKTLYTQARKDGRESEAAALLAAEDKDLYNIAFPQPKGSGLSALQQATRQSDQDEAEAWFNTLRGTRSPEAYEAMRTFDKMRNAPANRNRPAREIIKAVYDATKSLEESGYRKAQTGKLESSGDYSLPGLTGGTPPNLAELRAEWDRAAAATSVEEARRQIGPRP